MTVVHFDTTREPLNLTEEDDFDDFDQDVINSSRVSHTVGNRVVQMQQLETHKRTLNTGRDDRATSEQVLDPRTRLILFKLLSRGFLEKIDGCLSTGKEANVYYAKAGQQQQQDETYPTEYAIKIYKTSILIFKDRDKYVAGEHRWRKGYCKSNPRKMVAVWAEKELRNYKRIYQAGIPAPRPILLKSHILVMEFLGHEGWPSPRLKDANLSDSKLRQAYVQCVLILRHLYQRCRLVHGDLSEYNLLWHDNQIYVIDVSQSVETDHPSALDFLRKDASNINDYFQKVGRLDTMTVRQLFEFITAPVEDEQALLDSILQTVDEHAATMSLSSEEERRRASQQEQVNEAVFMSQFLPRSLNQVAERDVAQIEDGEVEETYAHAVAALTGNLDVLHAVAERTGNESHSILLMTEGSPVNDSDSESDDESDESEDDDSSTGDDDIGRGSKVFLTPEEREALRQTQKAERKAHKKLVKEEKQERRLTKVKKKDKKRAIKKSKAGNRKNK